MLQVSWKDGDLDAWACQLHELESFIFETRWYLVIWLIYHSISV